MPKQTANSNSNPQLPNNLNDIAQRVFYVLRLFLGTTVGTIIFGAIILVILLALALLRGA